MMGTKGCAGAFAEKFDGRQLSGCHLIVGLSGGADSMSLVHFLASHRQEGGWTLEAVHINHCLRGEESDRDQRRAEAFCRENRIPLTVERVDVAALAKERKQPEEVCGREVRYRCFGEAAREARDRGQTPVIVTAHTLSDDLETTLLHLVRGCSLDGLCGIPTARKLDESGILLVRPMLKISREEVEAYCAENRLPFVTDSSNLSDRYARNRVRLRVVPQMKAINPSLEETYLRMRESLSADRSYLQQQTDALLKSAENGPSRWNRETLAGAHEALRRRAEAEILRRKGLLVDIAQIRQLDGVVLGEKKALTLGQTRFQVRGGILTAETERVYTVQQASLPPDGNGTVCVTFTEETPDGEICAVWEKELFFQTVSAEEYFRQRKIYKKLLYFGIDYDTIKDDAVIRARMPGDFFCLPQSGGRKAVKKYFQEAHLSHRERKTRLMLAQGSEIIWLEGLGVGGKFRPGGQTKRVLTAMTERMETK